MSTTVVVGDGDVRFVHDDATLDQLAVVGEVAVTRASDVEPCRLVTTDGRQVTGWRACLRGGPARYFEKRADALAWEREWLESHGVPTPIR